MSASRPATSRNRSAVGRNGKWCGAFSSLHSSAREWNNYRARASQQLSGFWRASEEERKRETETALIQTSVNLLRNAHVRTGVYMRAPVMTRKKTSFNYHTLPFFLFSATSQAAFLVTNVVIEVDTIALELLPVALSEKLGFY